MRAKESLSVKVLSVFTSALALELNMFNICFMAQNSNHEQTSHYHNMPLQHSNVSLVVKGAESVQTKSNLKESSPRNLSFTHNAAVPNLYELIFLS